MKKRLDILLVEKGLAPTREKARALILAGEVLVNDVPSTKAGNLVVDDASLRLKNGISKYVSRGGDKLEGALLDFTASVKDLICLDVGSSTGGFTDCLLQNGAAKVYCIDVGTNQLDHKIRVDPRVSVHEKTHAKDLSQIKFNPVPTFCVVDVSFIGLAKILPYVLEILPNQSKILMLVKPQFELGPELIGKNGVPLPEVDPFLAVENLRRNFDAFQVTEINCYPSHVKGKKSENQEYFLMVTK